MTYKNLKIVNEIGGIQAVREVDGIAEYFPPESDQHKRATGGEYGPIASLEPSVVDPSAEKSQEARTQRDRLLKASDWTQVADAPVDQAAWAAYRQALRDIPQQDGFPSDVTWPEKP